MADDALTCARLTNPRPSIWDDIHEIYRANFPPEEQEPFERIQSAVADGRYTLIVAWDDASVVGFAILADLPATTAVFLLYLAVSARQHSRGIGSRLFRYACHILPEIGVADALVWEVEPPDVFDHDALVNRRIRFYERLGAEVIDSAAQYAIPNLVAEDTIALRLMWLAIDSRERPQKGEVANWVRGIYDVCFPEHKALQAQVVASVLA